MNKEEIERRIQEIEDEIYELQLELNELIDERMVLDYEEEKGDVE